MSCQHTEILDLFRERFPLFENIGGYFGEELQWEKIPWHFAFLLSAAANKTPGACCFVMDKSPGTTAIAAVIHALITLRKDLPNLLKNFAESTLSPGQRVRVKPNNFVYEFAGIWNEFPHLFRLRRLDDPSQSTSYPLSKIVCLEPTKQKIKKGTQTSDLGTCVTNELDTLLGFQTCGNNSIFCNLVLLSMAQARFATLLKSITLSPEGTTSSKPLSEYFSWGGIGPEGDLIRKDQNLASGEPVIAVSRLLESLEFTPSIPQKTVFVDGASGLARNPLAFDYITECHRVVIVASFDETEALEELRKRDTPTWYMSPESILIGESATGYRNRSSLIGVTTLSAYTRQRFKMDVIICHDTNLEDAEEFLDSVSRKIKATEDAQEIAKHLLQLYGIFLELSECCFGVDEKLALDLFEVEENIRQFEKWIDPAIFGELKSAIDKLKSIIDCGEFGQEKVKQFLEFADNNCANWAVVAKSARTAEILEKHLNNRHINLPVFTHSNIPSGSALTGIILPSWPNSRKFSQLKSKSVTTNVRVLAYPFETKWISSHKNRENARESLNGCDTDKLSQILGIGRHLLESLFPPASPSTPLSPPPIFDIDGPIKRPDTRRPNPATEGEESRQARFVQFSGNCYALLTEWAELPNLNPLIYETNLSNVKLEFVTVSKLSSGDFVLFRDSGDKEIVRILAEENFGEEQYEQTRMIAEKWKESQFRIDTNPEVIRQRLAKFGLKRTVQTITGWLSNPYRIGPGDFHDIELIAKAAGDHELLSIKNEIEEAITCIRGAHISAGGKLTQLLLGELGERIIQVDEQPTQIELDFGAAWVVHIEKIDTKSRNYPANLVNQLLWDDTNDF